jgi:hypothetical protein
MTARVIGDVAADVIAVIGQHDVAVAVGEQLIVEAGQ